MAENGESDETTENIGQIISVAKLKLADLEKEERTRLEKQGIVKEVGGAKRGRVYCAKKLLDMESRPDLFLCVPASLR